MSRSKNSHHGHRQLTREEIALWHRVTQDVRRRDGPGPHPTPESSPQDRPATPGETGGRQPVQPGNQIPTVMPTSGPVKVVPGPLDRKTVRRIKRGQLPVEGVLDLHGHTQQAAHRALDAFLAGSQAAGRRCVLVITGKGVRGEGKIRQALPQWLCLGTNAHRVIGSAPAMPKDGGDGAFYVYLRRAG